LFGITALQKDKRQLADQFLIVGTANIAQPAMELQAINRHWQTVNKTNHASSNSSMPKN